MSELPSGWTATTLGDVAKWGSGGTPSRSESSFYGGTIPWIKSGELNSRYITTAEEHITEAAVNGSSAKLFPAGSVAIAMYGATIGKTAILGIDAATNQACAVGAPIEGLIGKEFLYRLLQNEKEAFIEKGKGGAQPNISQAVIKAHVIGLPPLAEQTRINQKLDELLAQVDTLKARIDAIPTLLKRFRRSVLAAAFSGRLTEEWRGYIQNNSTHGWTQTTVGKFCKLKSGIAISADHEKTTGDFKYFKVGEMNLKGNEFYLQHTDRYLDKDDAPEKSLMPSGSILFPKRGGAIATNKKRILKEPSFVDLNIMGIIIPADVEIMYVYRWFETIDLAKLNTGSTIPQINNTDIAPLEIPLPPSAEQCEIVRRVEQLFTYADQLETKVTSAKSRIDHLTQSILAKAFRGELVPQDPNDEPASMLLKRIAASKLNKPAKSRQSRPPESTRMTKKSNAMTKHRQDEDVLGQPYLAEHLRRLGSEATSEALFKVAGLPVADFYKQLAWEVVQGLVVDLGETLEAKNEA